MADPAYAPFTPPYFYGAASATIAYTHPQIGEGFTPNASELFNPNYTTITYGNDYSRVIPSKTAYKDLSADAEGNFQPLQTMKSVRHAMSISSSVDLFGLIRTNKAKFGGDVPDPIASEDVFIGGDKVPVKEFEPGTYEDDVWVISTKFECPILSYNKTVQAGRAELGVKHSLDNRNNPLGMWMDYLEVPRNDRGVYLELRESGKYLEDKQGNGSLIDICGFGKAKKDKLGRIANKTDMYEAVVAIPFIDTGGINKLIPIDKDMFNLQKNNLLTSGVAIKKDN